MILNLMALLMKSPGRQSIDMRIVTHFIVRVNPWCHLFLLGRNVRFVGLNCFRRLFIFIGFIFVFVLFFILNGFVAFFGCIDFHGVVCCLLTILGRMFALMVSLNSPVIIRCL